MQACYRAYACRAILAVCRTAAMRDIVAGVLLRVDRDDGRARLCANRRYAGRHRRFMVFSPRAAAAMRPCARVRSRCAGDGRVPSQPACAGRAADAG
ncbi:hypothetical protein C6P91_01125 [Burkholderia multivorans]|nr:hypothetical protein C6P91_01125 [Burkholderia multivorans]